MDECIYCDEDVSEDYGNVCERHGALMYLISARKTFKDVDGKLNRRICPCDCQHTKKVNIVLSLLEKDIDSEMSWKIVEGVSCDVFEDVIYTMTSRTNLEKTLERLEKEVEQGCISEHYYNNHAKLLMYIKQIRDRISGSDTESD
jgi:hypothetical protein